MIISAMLSSRCACRAITYSGPIAATIGSIFVELKKNIPSRQCLTGRTDNAYAAGTASNSTRTVEPSVAMIEWARKGPMPVMASRNSDRVGVKMNFGGQVSAADSGLNAVITIHRTGMKNTIAAAQARTDPDP